MAEKRSFSGKPDAAAVLSAEQREILLHTLGLNYSPRHDRNSFCASIGGDTPTLIAIRGLVALGLMAERRTINEGTMQYFVATDEGRRVAEQLRPRPRKLTRSQARYQLYLDIGDGFGSFRAFLAWEQQKAQEARRGY